MAWPGSAAKFGAATGAKDSGSGSSEATSAFPRESPAIDGVPGGDSDDTGGWIDGASRRGGGGTRGWGRPALGEAVAVGSRGSKGAFGPWGFLAAGGLAFLNLALPLCLFWLAAGRRRNFRIRTLMSLPIAVAIPLMAFLTLAPWLPVGSESLLASENRVFLTGTVAGVPIVLYVGWVVAGVIRRRWRSVLAHWWR